MLSWSRSSIESATLKVSVKRKDFSPTVDLDLICVRLLAVASEFGLSRSKMKTLVESKDGGIYRLIYGERCIGSEYYLKEQYILQVKMI